MWNVFTLKIQIPEMLPVGSETVMAKCSFLGLLHNKIRYLKDWRQFFVLIFKVFTNELYSVFSFDLFNSSYCSLQQNSSTCTEFFFLHSNDLFSFKSFDDITCILGKDNFLNYKALLFRYAQLFIFYWKFLLWKKLFRKRHRVWITELWIGLKNTEKVLQQTFTLVLMGEGLESTHVFNKRICP